MADWHIFLLHILHQILSEYLKNITSIFLLKLRFHVFLLFFLLFYSSYFSNTFVLFFPQLIISSFLIIFHLTLQLFLFVKDIFTEFFFPCHFCKTSFYQLLPLSKLGAHAAVHFSGIIADNTKIPLIQAVDLSKL